MADKNDAREWPAERELHQLEQEFAKTDKGKLLTQAMMEVAAEYGMETDAQQPQCQTCKIASAYWIQLAAAKAMDKYAAAVTQERDALREFAQHKLGCWVRYKTTANWNGHNPACNCGLNEAMAAAEESQPK